MPSTPKTRRLSGPSSRLTPKIGQVTQRNTTAGTTNTPRPKGILKSKFVNTTAGTTNTPRPKGILKSKFVNTTTTVPTPRTTTFPKQHPAAVDVAKNSALRERKKFGRSIVTCYTTKAKAISKQVLPVKPRNVGRSKPKIMESVAVKKRSRRKRVKLNILREAGVFKKHPKTSIVAHHKFANKIPGRIARVVMQEMCSMIRNQMLENLEDEILKRYATLKSLKVNEDLNALEMQDEVMENMESQIISLQQLIFNKDDELRNIRRELKILHRARFVCCSFCAEPKDL